jgi:hypothetical protein
VTTGSDASSHGGVACRNESTDAINKILDVISASTDLNLLSQVP